MSYCELARVERIFGFMLKVELVWRLEARVDKRKSRGTGSVEMCIEPEIYYFPQRVRTLWEQSLSVQHVAMSDVYRVATAND